MKMFWSAPPRARTTLCALVIGCALSVAMTSAGMAEPQSAPQPDEVLAFGQQRVSRWIVDAVVRASNATGVDSAYLMALADKESSLLPDSKARTSSAEGLFQFVETTWLEAVRRYGGKHGYAAASDAIKLVRGRPTVVDPGSRRWILALRRDPFLSAVMAGEMVKTQREILAGKMARDPSFSELYVAHFLGSSAASRFVELLGGNARQSAPEAFPAAAKANRRIFFKAAETRKGAKTEARSVAEVQLQFDAMMNGRVARYAALRESEVAHQIASE